MNFSKLFSKFIKQNMNLFNMFLSDTKTSAGPLSGSDCNAYLGAQQMLMRRKSCLIPIS